MLRNFIKIAWRNIIKSPVYSGINVFGLSLGMAAALLMLLFARHEWSFDSFHSGADRTYRVWVKEFVEGHVHFNTTTPIVVGDALTESFPQIDRVTRVLNATYLIRSTTEEATSEAVYFVDPQFLRVFDFDILYGKPTFLDPTKIVLTRAEAVRHFGREDVVGETVELNIESEWQPRTVSAVLDDIPDNSSLQFSYLVPYAVFEQGLSENARACWTCVFGETYVQLDAESSIEDLLAATTPYFDKEVADIYPAGDYQVGFQNIKDIHLNSDFPAGLARVSDGKYPYIMLGIALLILLLAGINYVNLAVARSLTRYKEVGIRKVVGAGRSEIVLQHCGEAIVLTLTSAALALLLASALLPQFNLLFGQALSLSLSPSLIGVIALGSVILGVTAALYPAAVLSKFRPLDILSQTGSSSLGSKQIVLRSLVGFQFFLSVGLLVAALAVGKQADFLTSKNLGFHQEATMIVPLASTGSFSEDVEIGAVIAGQLRNETAGSAIDHVTWSNHVFGTPGWMRLGYMDEGSSTFQSFHLNGVDPRFVQAFDLEVVDGSDFQIETAESDNSVLVNEAFVRQFELADAVGSVLPGPFKDFRIRGVVADFHFASLHEAIEPLVLATDPLAIAQTSPDFVTFDSPTPKLSIKLAGSSLQEGINEVRAFWQAHVAGIPFDFSFVDDDLNQLYQAERRLNGIASAGTILAVIIAALGIFGISGIALNRRRKELGVRKILGATKANLIGLLFKDFGAVLIVAIVAAIPLSAWIIGRWLQDFAYHTQIGIFTYLAACAMLIGVCILAILAQGLKVTRLDPIDSIRED